MTAEHPLKVSGTSPDFTSAEFLSNHVDGILAFYDPNVFDPMGGFFHCFLDDGSVYDKESRHLVSSTRFVFNYAHAWLRGGNPKYKLWAEHGLRFLLEHHRQPTTGHYAWTLKGGRVDDGRAMAYGHAFVMLAGASAAQAGIPEGEVLVREAWELMERYFFEEAYSAYADERDAALEVLDPYRGQNANMHSVEALIAAFEATGIKMYLERAERVAKRFALELASGVTESQVWEHYTQHWFPDWTYHQDKPDDLFKPWGFQPGHQVEWAKLLLQLDGYLPAPWHQEQAMVLYNVAMKHGWDPIHGGLVYGYKPDPILYAGPESRLDVGANGNAHHGFADTHKYFWVQAEALAAAWRLWTVTNNRCYHDDYLRIWQWSWDHLVDHEYGAWFRLTDRAGNKVEPYKSPAGKVDYHTMGACWDVLAAMGK